MSDHSKAVGTVTGDRWQYRKVKLCAYSHGIETIGFSPLANMVYPTRNKAEEAIDAVLAARPDPTKRKA